MKWFTFENPPRENKPRHDTTKRFTLCVMKYDARTLQTTRTQARKEKQPQKSNNLRLTYSADKITSFFFP